MERKKHLLSLAAIALLAGLTMFLLLRGQELPQIAALLQQVDIRYMLIGLGGMALFFGCEAGAIRYLLRGCGYQPSLGRCFSYSLIDFYFSAITPGCCGGQPSQIVYMQRDGIAVGSSSVSLLLFNSAYHVSVLLVAGISWLLSAGGAGLELGAIKYLLIYGIAAQLLIAVGYCFAIFSKKLAPALAERITRLLYRLHIVKDKEQALAKVSAQIVEYQRGADYIRRRPQAMLIVLLITLSHVLALYSLPFWIYKAFGLSACGFWTIIALQASLTLAMESLPLPGGVGVTEGSFMLLYAGVFGPTFVLPALLLTRGINYYACLVAGGLTAVTTRKRKTPLTAAVRV